MVSFGEIVTVATRLSVYGMFKASGYGAIAAFIEKQTMTETLTAIGHTSYKSAIYALELMEKSKDKKTQVRSAANHLEFAHTAFKNTHSPDSEIQRAATEITRKNAAMMDVWTLCLMAFCRLYLDEKQTAKQHVEEAQIAYNVYRTLAVGNTNIVSVFNPSQWAASLDDVPIIAPQSFKTFVYAMLGSGWNLRVEDPVEITILERDEPVRQAFQFTFIPTNSSGSAKLIPYNGKYREEERVLSTSSTKPVIVRFSKVTKVILKANMSSYKKIPFDIDYWVFSDLDY